MLTYKMQAFSDGQLAWREMAYQINIESLPACAILGTNCIVHINQRLAAYGRLFGRFYFHSQYVQCRDLLDNTFERPSRAEIGDDNLDEASPKRLLRPNMRPNSGIVLMNSIVCKAKNGLTIFRLARIYAV